MTALSKILVIFLWASNANAFTSLSLVNGIEVRVDHLIWFEGSTSKPTNEPSCEPICEPTIQMDSDEKLLNNFSPKKNWVTYKSESLAEQPTDVTNSFQNSGPLVEQPIAATNSSKKPGHGPNKHESSCASRLVARVKCLKSHETSCTCWLVAHAKCLNSHASSYAFLLAARAKCLNKSNVFTFRLIFGFIQHYQRQLQQDLVDFSSLNAFSIAAKLNSSLKDFQCQSFFSVNAKANSAMLINMPMSQQCAMIRFNNGSSQFIVKYIYWLDSEGACAALWVDCQIDSYLKWYHQQNLWRSVETNHLCGYTKKPQNRSLANHILWGRIRWWILTYLNSGHYIEQKCGCNDWRKPLSLYSTIFTLGTPG